MGQLQSWPSFRLTTVRALTGQEFVDLITHPMTAEYDVVLRGIVRAGEVEPLSTLVWECVINSRSHYIDHQCVSRILQRSTRWWRPFCSSTAHTSGGSLSNALICAGCSCVAWVRKHEMDEGVQRSVALQITPLIATWRMCDPPKVTDMPAALEGLISFRGSEQTRTWPCSMPHIAWSWSLFRGLLRLASIA